MDDAGKGKGADMQDTKFCPKKTMCSVLVTIAIASLMISEDALADRQFVIGNQSLGIWEGWGTSLAWWGKGVGASAYEATYADLLFTTKNVTFNGRLLPGLGLNIVRYNIGGGGRPEDNVDGRYDSPPRPPDFAAPDYPPNDQLPDPRDRRMPWFRDIDGFWVNWFSRDPRTSSWDWTRDPNQLSLLQAAHKRGAKVELFSNAPMWWMTQIDPQNPPNGYEAGTAYRCRVSADTWCKSSAGGKLQEWNYGDYAYYLAAVAAHARRHWGVHVTSIAPFNEPMARYDYFQENWYWRYPKNQEGVHLDRTEQVIILQALRHELNRHGMRDVKIAASDESRFTDAIETYQSLKSNGAAWLVDRLNTHSYPDYPQEYAGSLGGRDAIASGAARLRTELGSKPAWVSEYGDGDPSGKQLSTIITTNINVLRPTAWLYWQAVEYTDKEGRYSPPNPWGLVNGAFGKEDDASASTRGEPTTINRKYFVFAQYTRFIRPGFEIVPAAPRLPNDQQIWSDAIAALEGGRGRARRLVIVLRSVAAESLEIDLTAASDIACPVASVTATNFDDSAGSKQFHTTTALVIGKKLAINAEKDTVYSIVVPGVTLATGHHGGQRAAESGHDERSHVRSNRCDFELN